MKKEIRLYNVLFPLWMLLMLPQMWLIVLPGNFIIDSLVLIGLMHFLKITEKKSFYKENIFKVFGFGMLSDIIGAGFLLLCMIIVEGITYADELRITIPAVMISAVCIFLFNYFITFKTCEKGLRLRLALTYAIVTAPYTFLVPSSLLYNF